MHHTFGTFGEIRAILAVITPKRSEEAKVSFISRQNLVH
jgi:hypothetical protein